MLSTIFCFQSPRKQIKEMEEARIVTVGFTILYMINSKDKYKRKKKRQIVFRTYLFFIGLSFL